MYISPQGLGLAECIHPLGAVNLDRLTATANVYLTNLCDPTRDYTGAHLATGDITIRSLDGLTYHVTYIQYVHLPVILKP